MKKELLIIVYKINVSGLSASNAVQYLESIVKTSFTGLG